MKALVLLGGGAAPPALLLRELAGAGLVVCADSGAKYLAGTGRTPDVLIGDMDSIDPALLRSLQDGGARVLRTAAEKDETDGVLAVDEAMALGADGIVLLGALGGRVDHLLGNLMLLVRSGRRGVPASILDGDCEITAVTGEHIVQGRRGDTVSLLPAGSGVSVRYLSGMQYGPGEPLPLPVDLPVGVSNVMTGDEAHIVAEGWVYVIRYFKEGSTI